VNIDSKHKEEMDSAYPYQQRMVELTSLPCSPSKNN